MLLFIIYNNNYGYPISSYGENYNFKEKVLKEQKSFEFLKNHKTKNFKEPIFSFVPSIGISEIVEVPETFSKYWKNNFNKTWSNNLINLKPVIQDGFLANAIRRNQQYEYDVQGGYHCIAAGMHYGPTDIVSVLKNNILLLRSFIELWRILFSSFKFSFSLVIMDRFFPISNIFLSSSEISLVFSPMTSLKYS